MNEPTTAPEARGDDSPAAVSARKEDIRRRADQSAVRRQWWIARNGYFHQRDIDTLELLVRPGGRVLDLGCGVGNVRAALEPSVGVGVDFSERVIEIARDTYPGLRFVVADIEDKAALRGIDTAPFDYIVMSDTIGSVDDCQALFESLHDLCHRDTRIIISYYAHLWEPVLWLAELAGMKMPQGAQNYLHMSDIANILEISNYGVVKQEQRILLPLRAFGLGTALNRYLAPFPMVRRLCLRHYNVARSLRHAPYGELSATVVIPCRNERGNIEQAVRRMPQFCPDLEVIFVEGHSSDGTFEEIERIIAAYDGELDLRATVQDGIGKGDAVRKGFEMARGDVLMILDADLTVAPEDLAKFYNCVVSGRGNFVNGSRMVYPVEKHAMRFLNMVANTIFARLFSWLLNQRITDSLCGTKVLTRAHYRRIAEGRSYFGDFDPFGDFDLLFGAAKENLKIIEVPVRYSSRAYGETQIDRFRHGWLLARMFIFAFRKMKGL